MDENDDERDWHQEFKDNVAMGYIDRDGNQLGPPEPDWTDDAPAVCESQAALARHGHTDVDRLRIATEFDSAVANGVGMSLGAWAGRGDWARTSDDFRTSAGRRALTEIEELIYRLTVYRAGLACAVFGDDLPPRGRASTDPHVQETRTQTPETTP